jgi:DNA-binding NtrC family response regulator
MLRVLLVIDDYSELTYVQTLLKKVGFDTEGVQTQRKYADAALGFNPQVVIVTGHGKNVDGFRLAQSIQRRNNWPKVIITDNSGEPYSQQFLDDMCVDKVIGSPMAVRELLQVLAAIGDMDFEVLIEKYNKIKGSLQRDGAPQGGSGIQGSDSKVVSTVKKSALVANPEEDKKRKSRFEQNLIPGLNTKSSSYQREQIIAATKKIRTAEAPEDLPEVEDQRKKFVKALFRKDR